MGKREIQQRMEDLHEAVAEDLHQQITTGVADNGTIANAIKFLKDNGVTVPLLRAKASEGAVQKIGKVINAPFGEKEAKQATG
jgi:hypothetical protein